MQVWRPTHGRSRGNRFALGSILVGALLALLLGAAPAASAAETLFWDNYTGTTNSIAFANLDGSGGGQFNTVGAVVQHPEGMAIDSATGRLFWSNSNGGAENKGGIFFANLDGSGGGGQLNTAGAPVDAPLGVTIDPTTRKIYWANVGQGGSDKGSIAYANVDGGGGGQLDTTGATVAEPGPVAIDVAGGRIYWGNYETKTIAYASLAGGGGGALNLSGATPPLTITGLAVDPASGRIYWVNNAPSSNVSYAALSGTGGGDVSTTGATFNSPYGMAFDPATGRIFWGNYGNGGTRAGAIGYASAAGGGGALTIATAPVDGPQDPLIFKSPSGTGAPQISRSSASRVALSCSQGSWADAPGSFVYQAPRTYSYQWTLNGAAIGGATASSYTASRPGAYACVVTGSNANGSASQTSSAAQVSRATLKLTVKPRKAVAKPGHQATFKVKVTNNGDLTASKVKVCAKALNASKCRSLGAIAGGKARTAKLKLKVQGSAAAGSHAVTFSARGAASKPVRAKLIVK